jgi:hypothetical protein
MSKTVFITQNSPEIIQKLKDAGFSICACVFFDGSIWLGYHPDNLFPYAIHGEGYADEEDCDLDLKPLDRIQRRLAEESYYSKEREFFDTVEEFLKKYKPNHKNDEKNSNY